MSADLSRREFVRNCGVTCGGLGIAGAAASAATESGDETKGGPPLSSQAIDEEVRRRVAHHLPQTHLAVNYYRIRRRLAYPLPVSSLSLPNITCPSIPNYPWATWMTWELEERLYSLGWAAEWFGDADAQAAAENDLAALASWPEYGQYGAPDLSSGHAGRMLWVALERWSWPSSSLRATIQDGLNRLVEEAVVGSEKKHGGINTKADVFAQAEPHRILHNIPFIGTIVAAMAAKVIGHPKADLLNERTAAIFGAILDMRDEGFTEAVAYDGYVLDFIGDWLETVSAEQRGAVLDHPNLRHFLEESYMLAAPGAAVEVAELSDVEPKEMPFHLGGQAKLQKLQPDPVRAWHLSRCPVPSLRTDALASLRPMADTLQGKPAEAGALNAHYAAVLRSGWENDDLAAVVSCHVSPMSHLQDDNGTVVIGTRGRWFIADPGYQQYVKGLEREFTLGPTAHNYPVINGITQVRKAGKLEALESKARVHRAAIDLTACYGDDLDADSVVRTVWLADNKFVVVADEMRVNKLESVAYHWHGYPEAAWGYEEPWMLLYLDGARLWFRSPQCPATDAALDFLPGSRGQLTLLTAADPATPVVWWAFALTEAPPALALADDARRLELGDATFAF